MIGQVVFNEKPQPAIADKKAQELAAALLRYFPALTVAQPAKKKEEKNG